MLPIPVRTSLRRRGAALLVAVAALLAGGVATAGAASAHDELVSTSPREGATVAAPSQVVLRFSDIVLASFSRMVLTRPDGTNVTTPVAVAGQRVTGRLPSTLAPGRYTLSWRVSSADGHPVSGQLHFAVAAAATATTTPSPTTTSPTTTSPTTATSPTSASSPTSLSPTLVGTQAPSAQPAAGSTSAGASARGGSGVPAGAVALVAAIALVGALVVAVRRARRQSRG